MPLHVSSVSPSRSPSRSRSFSAYESYFLTIITPLSPMHVQSSSLHPSFHPNQLLPLPSQNFKFLPPSIPLSSFFHPSSRPMSREKNILRSFFHSHLLPCSSSSSPRSPFDSPPGASPAPHRRLQRPLLRVPLLLGQGLPASENKKRGGGWEK